jgi:hypothetical protein
MEEKHPVDEFYIDPCEPICKVTLGISGGIVRKYNLSLITPDSAERE